MPQTNNQHNPCQQANQPRQGFDIQRLADTIAFRVRALLCIVFWLLLAGLAIGIAIVIGTLAFRVMAWLLHVSSQTLCL